MQKWRLAGGVVAGLLLVAFFYWGTSNVLAVPPISSSDNYQMVDGDFEGSAGQEACSDGYCSRGFGDEEGEGILEVSVDAGEADLGVLSASETAVKTSTVTVRNYLSFGYTMQIIGSAPKIGNHTLNTLTTPSASEPGIEQFGINVVENTTLGLGANPLQDPDGGKVFGTVINGYGTPDRFKYNSGDEVAQGASTMEEVGQTTYTISMITNTSNVTPAGQYAADLSIVVVPIY